MARPFTKPNITDLGTIRINFPSLNIPAEICMIPMRTTVAKRYSTPCSLTRLTITTARAPVAPEIMPGLPPATEAINPTKNAAYKPTKGSTPATNANATASGTNAKATVRPERISFLRLWEEFFLEKSLKIMFLT